MPEKLPKSLESLDCAHNLLTKLPERLSDTLEGLICDHNKLVRLSNNLPNNLKDLYCCGNKFTELSYKFLSNVYIRDFFHYNNGHKLCINRLIKNSAIKAVFT